MTAAVEAGREEKTDDFDGQSRTDDTAAHGENVGIVVAPAVFCRKHVVAKLTLDNDTFENTGKSRFFERRTSRVLY